MQTPDRPAAKSGPSFQIGWLGPLSTLLWLSVIAAVIAADQLVKWFVSLNGGLHRTVLPGFLTFDYCINTGAAFSLFSGARWLLVGVTGLMVAACLFALLTGQSHTGWGRAALSLIVAGGLSNLYDRVVRGYVVDFVSLHFGFYDFAVFNVADSCICVGAVLLCVVYLLRENREKKRLEKS